eukprot:6212465-Pleurochrysis_carterae.AAC.1
MGLDQTYGARSDLWDCTYSHGEVSKAHSRKLKQPPDSIAIDENISRKRIARARAGNVMIQQSLQSKGCSIFE